MTAFSPNLNLTEPALGEFVNDWNVPVNGNWAILDQKFGSISTIAFTNANVTLTNIQAAFWGLNATGTLTGNVALILPSGVAGTWIISNNTTGSFTLTVKGSSGDTGVIVPQNSAQAVYSNESVASLTISSGQVIAALGYTPANRAGDTFSGATTFSAGITVSTVGIAVTAGPLTLTSGNMTITSGNFALDSGTFFVGGGLATFANGVQIGGGLTVVSGGSFFGGATATTVSSTDNSTNVATTAFVNSAAPGILAGMAYGSIGSYVVASNSVDVTPGTDVLGNTLTVNSSGSGSTSSFSSATVWRYMGGNGTTGGRLWQRVS